MEPKKRPTTLRQEPAPLGEFAVSLAQYYPKHRATPVLCSSQRLSSGFGVIKSDSKHRLPQTHGMSEESMYEFHHGVFRS